MLGQTLGTPVHGKPWGGCHAAGSAPTGHGGQAESTQLSPKPSRATLT